MPAHPFAPKPGMKAFLIGIGGVSMCALAEVLSRRGLNVSGSDISPGPTVARLRALGIPVAPGHRAEHVHGADCVIRTAAARDDNVEVLEARRLGLPVYERAHAWGVLMREHKNAVCVAGTHGKTTTTSMLTHIALEAERDPTVMIGATLPLIGGGHRVGGGELIVMEACEYCRSFLNFSPTIALVLNMEADHLDYFRDMDDISDAFRAFTLKTPQKTGQVILNADDPVVIGTLAGLPRKVTTFGLNQPADVQAANITFENGLPRFDILLHDKFWAHAALRVPGRHNVSNALAAATAAMALGIPAGDVARGLASFTGASRRFETKGTFLDALVVEDYAHHPSEITATLQAARQMDFGRVICVFQPHTYSRTIALFDDFVRALSAADQVIVSEIYSARENNTLGISSRSLSDAIPGALFFSSQESICEHLTGYAGPGDLILTMGAGDISKLSTMLVEYENKLPVSAG